MVKKALMDLREVTLLNRLKPVTADDGFSPSPLSVLYGKLSRNVYLSLDYVYTILLDSRTLFNCKINTVGHFPSPKTRKYFNSPLRRGISLVLNLSEKNGHNNTFESLN